MPEVDHFQGGSTPPAPKTRRFARLYVAFGAIFLGGAPTGCLSDVTLPLCVQQGADCNASAGVGGSSTLGGGANSGGVNASSAGNDASNPSGGSSGDAGALHEPGGGGSGGSGGAPISTGGGSGGMKPLCDSCLISPEELPAPCDGKPYATALGIGGGTPPYVWRIQPPVSGWSISLDPTSTTGARATLNAQPAGATRLTVEVTDARGQVATRSYVVDPRSACWFAYTALGVTGPELELVDPIVAPDQPQVLSQNHGVYDFKFSPDGRHLVYRFGADASHPQGRHLALLSLAPWAEQTLDFAEDAVTAYSWSADSATLAVAFETPAGSFLGGAKLLPSTSVGAPAEAVYLIPTPAFVDSELSWIGDRYLAMNAEVIFDPTDPSQVLPNPGRQRTPLYSVLGSHGFEPQVPLPGVVYSASAVLQPSDVGFFMIAADLNTTFYSLPSNEVASHAFVNVVSPSGHFSAALAGVQLQLFDARGGSVVDPVYASAPGQGCPKLLAWAKGQERLACVANVTSTPPGQAHGELRIFDVRPPSTLSMSVLPGYCVKDDTVSPASTCPASQYVYTEENASSQARAFSPSGRWFAFTTGSPDVNGANTLYWADVSTRPPSFKRTVILEANEATSTQASALAFSADEQYLLLQRENQLTAHRLAADPNSPDSVIVSAAFEPGNLQATAPCSEDFLGAPSLWCGNAERALPFAWAPDSRFAAYRSQGMVAVVEFTQFFSPAWHFLPAPECGETCKGQFAFQPQP